MNMKTKSKEKKIYSFSSLSAPDEFISRLCETANQSKLGIKLTEAGICLELESNKGGEVVYLASVSANENGGSVILGTIETIPWHTRPAKKRPIWNKILTVIAYILAAPFILFGILSMAIIWLIIRIIHGKSEEPDEEEILCNFMTNKMCCTRENNQ